MPYRLEQRQLAEIVEASHEAIITFRIDGTITSWNSAAERLYGYSAEEAVGQSVLMLVPAERRDAWLEAAERLEKNIPYLHHETKRIHKDGTTLDVSMTVSPLRDEAGQVRSAVTIARDVTEQKRTLRELGARLRQQEAVAELGGMALRAESLQPLFDLAAVRLVDTLSVEFTVLLENRPDTRSLLLRAGHGWRKGIVGTVSVPSGEDRLSGHTMAAAGPVVIDDLRAEPRFKSAKLLHEHGVVSGMTTLVAGAGGEPFGVLGVHTREHRTFTAHDVNFLQAVANVLATAIQNHQAREGREVLLHELRHRIGNLFTQILALHRQTAENSESTEELITKFEQRVRAISAAHAVLAREDRQQTDLGTLLEGLLVAYQDRIRLEGPPVRLSANDSFAIALALNELVMNASKYGCFRDERGTLSVTWTDRPGAGKSGFDLDWRENCNGPPTGAAAEDGFGTRLIRMMIENTLSGSMARSFEADGLHCRISVPARDTPPEGEQR